MPRPTITSWAGPLFKRQMNNLFDWFETAVSSGAIADGSVTLPKLADMNTDSLLGRDTAGTGPVEALTPAQARGILNVADGATANASDAALRDRSTHTGITVIEVIAGDPGAPVAGQVWINSTV